MNFPDFHGKAHSTAAGQQQWVEICRTRTANNHEFVDLAGLPREVLADLIQLRHTEAFLGDEGLRVSEMFFGAPDPQTRRFEVDLRKPPLSPHPSAILSGALCRHGSVQNVLQL